LWHFVCSMKSMTSFKKGEGFTLPRLA